MEIISNTGFTGNDSQNVVGKPVPDAFVKNNN